MQRRHVLEAFQSFNGYAISTRYQRTQALRQLLHLLTDEDDAPKLWKHVPKVQLALPRNVTVTNKEKEAVLAISPPYMRCWILLCSDLAMRSGTAAQIRPSEYDAERNEVTFTTKYGEKVTLPVTDELRQLFNAAITMGRDDAPFVSALHTNGTIGVLMLRQRFQMLCRQAKVSKRICPHDLRRTTAVRVHRDTKDLRLVQAILGHRRLTSTFHYLDHHNTTVQQGTLELAKLNPTTETIQ